MIGRIILIVLTFLLLTGTLNSQVSTVTVSGSDPEYAGKDLEFFLYSERTFNSVEIVANTKVDKNGAFSVSFPLEKTQCLYCNTPLYRAFVFVEPGKTYNVKLPPYPSSSIESKKYPFYIPPQWHMVPMEEHKNEVGELNLAIYTFDQQFEPFLDKQILRYYNPKQSRMMLDSFILANQEISVLGDNEYFEGYTLYKMAILGFLVNQFSHSDLYDDYLKNKPVQENNPSWWEFFKLYYDRYLSSLTKKEEFSDAYSLIGKGSFYALNQLLKNDPALYDDKIREWVILKEIHNSYYENSLPLSTVNNLCDSLSENSSSDVSKILAAHIKRDISLLLQGSLPPSAQVLNSAGDTLDISSLKGKYSYLGFCSLNSRECLQEFEYLKYFFHKHGKYIDILVILPESEKEAIASFTEENSIPWVFWYALDNSRVLKDYKVMAYPVFYLLDREGRLIMSPASMPSAGFEQHLFQILKGRGEI